MKEAINSKKRILLQMFDVRPVNEAGDLDMERIGKISRIAEIEKIEEKPEKHAKLHLNLNEKIIEDVRKPSFLCEELRRFNESLLAEREEKRRKKRKVEIESEDYENVRNISVEFKGEKNVEEIFENPNFEKHKSFDAKEKLTEFFADKISTFRFFKFFSFGKIPIALLLIFFIFGFASKGLKIKREGLVKGQEAFAELAAAEDSIRYGNFNKSYIQFNSAYEKLNEVSHDLDGVGNILIDSTKYLPFLSKISSGGNLLIAGRDISMSGALLSEILKTAEDIKKGENQEESVSYLEIFKENQEKLKKIAELLKNAQNNLEDVNTDDIPNEEKGKFIEIMKKLPEINNFLESYLNQEEIFIDILGGNGPRKYLFLFQNNQEMRATGGFIGSYGLLDIFNGRVRKFFIDGIFNPDGQLKEKVVPPIPIQKISAAWSLHDSNWFPDFPVSAEKACWFYEKTGGPTVDGVIAMTPTVIQKLLEITGPIEMEEYETTVDEKNFIEKIQYEVEIDYDKELNQPKKILADLAPKVLDKIFNSGSFSDISKTMNMISQSLNEKHILIYSKNWAIEKALSENGWSGEILDTSKDYISVINTNINGYKTDGVIDEKISHKAQIQLNGDIINTVTIKRTHNGGDTPYEWWNKVNADYMRVYVPKGSRLISAEGQTREFSSPPLDYGALGFKRDAQVQMEEDSIELDEESGTRIYQDSGKTVFANWVYVSPKESVTVKYVYVLPFKINIDNENPIGAYSLLAQKQSGSLGSEFSFEVEYPNSYEISWKYPENSESENISKEKNNLKLNTDLRMNKFFGLAFLKKQHD